MQRRALLIAAGLALTVGGRGSVAQRKIPPEIGPRTYFERAADLERAGKMAEAIRLYTEAARSGDGKAAYRLGEIYERGLGGVDVNRDDALKWYNAARVMGYPPLVGDFPDRKKTK